MNKIISIIVIILIIIFIGYFVIDYRKNNSPSVKEYINNNLGSIFFSLGLLFSFFGLITMISGLIEQICNLADETGVYNRFAIFVFGISLFSMAGSIQQTRKSNEEAAQLKKDINDNFKDISKKIDSLNPSNEYLHDEIEKLKQENQRILNLLEDKNQKEVCILSKIVNKIKK